MVYRTTALFALAASATLVLAQEYTDFTAWMKTSGTALQTLNKLESKTGSEAVSQAERLGGIYENMIGFWRQRNAPDAVKWSEEGKAAALQLASAAHAGNAEQAAAALKTLGGTCRSCHTEYRTKTPDGKYAFVSDEELEKKRAARKKK